MGQKEAPWIELPDCIEGGFPKFEGNVRWRRGGENEAISLDTNTRSVPHKCYPVRWVKVRNVVRGMTRCIKDLHLPFTQGKSFPTLQNLEVALGNRQELAKQRLHLRSVKTLCAGQKFCRINHMRRAPAMNVHAEPRTLSGQGSRRPGMIQVDVSEQYHV